MPSDQGDGKMPRVTVSVPQDHKTALDHLAEVRSEPGSRTYTSQIHRDAIHEYLIDHYDELPEEAQELLDVEILPDNETSDGQERADA